MSSAIPIDIYHNSGSTYQAPQRFRRESMAHSQGMGGVSWGGMSVGSWLRDEIMFSMPNASNMNMNMSPINSLSYLLTLEANFCKDYPCCGQLLPTLHDLLRHYEDSHIPSSPPLDAPIQMQRMQSLDTVSTNEVFLTPGSTSMNVAGDDNGFMAQPNNEQNTLMMMDEDETDICIDDPARRLYLTESAGVKPYKCNVIGCDRSYKNPNGLKYHRRHGHENQKLQLNEDGTYSVIDPVSNTPYPDGMGLEEDKPYQCEICGKKYKNLNGLKYHRGHSTH